ncbi:hypothetical protein LZ30DRAFT_480342 [Colletotrichum cereale]|nr:hypothetical protein LZ30DRAFT_480342 [Colletotrichum cereale]
MFPPRRKEESRDRGRGWGEEVSGQGWAKSTCHLLRPSLMFGPARKTAGRVNTTPTTHPPSRHRPRWEVERNLEREQASDLTEAPMDEREAVIPSLHDRDIGDKGVKVDLGLAPAGPSPLPPCCPRGGKGSRLSHVLTTTLHNVLQSPPPPSSSRSLSLSLSTWRRQRSLPPFFSLPVSVGMVQLALDDTKNKKKKRKEGSMDGCRISRRKLSNLAHKRRCHVSQNPQERKVSGVIHVLGLSPPSSPH